MMAYNNESVLNGRQRHDDRNAVTESATYDPKRGIHATGQPCRRYSPSWLFLPLTFRRRIPVGPTDSRPNPAASRRFSQLYILISESVLYLEIGQDFEFRLVTTQLRRGAPTLQVP